MSIKVKATLVIILIVFCVTAVNLFTNLHFSKQNTTRIMEQELFLARDIADGLVSAKLRILTEDARNVAGHLLRTGFSEGMAEVMELKLEEYDDFLAFTVFNRDGIIAYCGKPIAPADIANEGKFVEMAYDGKSVITTQSSDAEVDSRPIMHIFTPIGYGRVLSVSIPGMLLTDMLSDFSIWGTGGIYMVDQEGTIIAAYRADLVTARRNLIVESKTNPQLQRASDFFQGMISSEDGSGQYDFEGEERLCAYKLVSDSLAGWHIAAVLPLSGSHGSEGQTDLLFITIIFLFAGIIIAILLSDTISRPFIKINEQNRVLEDLNETIMAQSAQLTATHERAMLMLDSTPISCNLWNKDLVTFDCNEAAVRLFGLRDKQEYLDNFYKLSPEYQPDGQRTDEKTLIYVQKAFDEGEFRFEWLHQKLDGTPIPVEMTLVRVEYNDAHAIAAYARDLREYKKMMSEIETALREAQNANEAKSDFLARMSHEMRTPLNAVIGLSELMLDAKEFKGESFIRLDKISNAGRTLLNTVNDILDISKIEAGRMELVMLDYDTPSLINDAVAQSVLHKGEKDIQFLLNISDELPARLYGDELRVKQMLNNLLSNAFKYTKEGKVGLDVDSTRDGDRFWLTARVSDTGIGITQEDIDNLFDDYVQVDTKANRSIMGTGLGLSITRRMVEMMGGAIKVESDYGKGSVFTLRFPQGFVSDVVIGADVAKNLQNFNYSVSKHRNSHKTRLRLPYAKVLVVDDIINNLDVAKGMMSPYGMQIDCVTSGQQAIDAVKSEKVKYDAVFMDHMMPVMDGVEATRVIRKEIGTEYARTVPIIALTANAISGSEQMFLENGFQDFISKPIEMNRLEAAIRKWVRDKDKEKSLGKHVYISGQKVFNIRSGKDRRIRPTRRNGPGRRESERLTIEGLDMSKGVERFGGDEKLFLQILRSYAVNTVPLLEQLNAVNKSNLGDYSITVHGVKSSSRGIYANDVGNMAEALEMASKDGDFAFVEAKNPELIEATEKLIANIEGVLARMDAGKQKPAKERPDKEMLAKLLVACEDYDMDGVDDAMAKIESFEYRSDDGLAAWLRDNVDRMNLTQIMEKLSAITE
ncbi:MAG: ATP-binding protein [Clostridiales bacterium]|nr:ATP-binding protein [Clostridiales bacterium]